MSAVNDGGPAFPEHRAGPMYFAGPNGQPRPVMETVGGMSLRDWFAGQALAGMVPDTAQNKALAAYAIADAMLAAREAKS